MYSSNPFPSAPNNVFFPPNFLFDQEKDCSSFNHQNINIDPFFSGDCFHDPYNNLSDPPSPAIDHNITSNKQDMCRQLFFKEPGLQTCEEDQDDLLQTVISSCKKKSGSSRKDGHSKIYTAQGPRDRRVRLSIDISRKFFCLQDLLGFDKASQTLDWLFSKCKPAIKELVAETNPNSSSTATYQSKTNFLEAIINGYESETKSEDKDDDDGKRKKIMIEEQHGGFQDLNFGREQPRSVARARAKERVREKMRIKQLDDELKTFVHYDFDYDQNFKSSAGESHDRVISAYPGAW